MTKDDLANDLGRTRWQRRFDSCLPHKHINKLKYE